MSHGGIVLHHSTAGHALVAPSPCPGPPRGESHERPATGLSLSTREHSQLLPRPRPRGSQDIPGTGPPVQAVQCLPHHPSPGPSNALRGQGAPSGRPLPPHLPARLGRHLERGLERSPLLGGQDGPGPLGPLMVLAVLSGSFPRPVGRLAETFFIITFA